MKCPFCGSLQNRVLDSRLTREGEITRRRRECEGCNKRFTTYERVEESLPLVVKKDGRREAYDRAKLVSGLKRACEKRPISIASIDALADRVEALVQERAEKEVSSTTIGEEVMRELHGLDEVAYVRFASVYRQFRDLNQFIHALNDLLQQRAGSSAAPGGPPDDAPEGTPRTSSWK